MTVELDNWITWNPWEDWRDFLFCVSRYTRICMRWFCSAADLQHRRVESLVLQRTVILGRA